MSRPPVPQVESTVPPPHAGAAGASLIDALIALLLVITVSAGVAHLLVWSRRAAWAAAVKSTAVRLAIEKLEGLQALDWHVDSRGSSVSDTSTDLTGETPGPGGPGLQQSPAGTLETETSGFADFVDGDGRWLAAGARAPAHAAFVRRWAVEPLASDPADTLVLTVLVIPAADAASPARAARAVRLSTVRTRTKR